jgi:hypothetical protein
MQAAISELECQRIQIHRLDEARPEGAVNLEGTSDDGLGELRVLHLTGIKRTTAEQD